MPSQPTLQTNAAAAGPANRVGQEEDHPVEAHDGGGECRQVGAKDGEDDDKGGRCSARPTPSAGAIRCSASSATAGASRAHMVLDECRIGKDLFLS
jgi:hypothetical protein